MKGKYSTFYQAEDQDILLVSVHYEIYQYPMETDFGECSLRVHHYQSGDITQYIPDSWMYKFEEMARLEWKEHQDRFDHFLELSSRETHNPIVHQVMAMMQAGWTNEQIIDKLVAINQEMFKRMSEAIAMFHQPGPFLVSAESLANLKKS